MQHADDHFLPDVAAFAEADRARLDPRLERNRLLVHVAIEHRHARLDADRSAVCSSSAAAPAAAERAAMNAPACRPIDEHVVARFTRVG